MCTQNYIHEKISEKLCHNDILLPPPNTSTHISFWYFSSNRILMYRDKNHNFLIYVILMEDNLRKVKILLSTFYSTLGPKLKKKNVATNIKSSRAAVISKICALFLSLLLTVIQLGSMTHWIILQFWFHSNWFEGQTTTEEIYTWKFFYNTTTSNVFFCSIGTWFEFFSSFQSENTSTV